MDIATLINVSGQFVSPDQTNIAISDKSTTNVFGQLLREFVMQGSHIAEQDTQLSSNTHQGIHPASLLAVFGHSQVALDLSEEASLSGQEQDSISLTEVLAALQSLISKDPVSLNVGQIDDTTLSKSEEDPLKPIKDTEDDIDPAILDLAGLLSVQVQPNLLASPPGQGINVIEPITSPDIVSAAEAELTLSPPKERALDPAVQVGSVFEGLVVPEIPVSSKEMPQISSLDASGIKEDTTVSAETDSIETATVAGQLSTDIVLNSDEVLTKVAVDSSSHSMIGTTTDQIRNTGKSSTLLEAKAQTEFTVPIQPSAESTTPTTAPSISEMAFIRTKPELPNISALHQIVDSVGVLAQQHKTEVRLHLKPESLGQVLVHLDFTGDHISVRMLAETSQAQKLIHDHLSQLKDAFATQGLQINGLSVNISNDASTFDLPGRQSNDETRQPAQNPINPLSDESNQPVTTGSTVNGWLSLHSVDYHV